MSITVETWICPQHGVIAKGVRDRAMVTIISSHLVNDHCYEFLSMHSEDMETDRLIRKKTQRLSEETKDE